MKRVYRYEINGNGPYICFHSFGENQDFYDDFEYRLKLSHGDNDTHPGIRCDIDEFTSDIICACHSISLLEHWFNGFEDDLLLLGFELVEIETAKVIETYSGLQCGINKKDIISKRVIKTLYPENNLIN